MRAKGAEEEEDREGKVRERKASHKGLVNVRSPTFLADRQYTTTTGKKHAHQWHWLNTAAVLCTSKLHQWTLRFECKRSKCAELQ